jgi:hypothetical protein
MYSLFFPDARQFSNFRVNLQLALAGQPRFLARKVILEARFTRCENCCVDCARLEPRFAPDYKSIREQKRGSHIPAEAS